MVGDTVAVITALNEADNIGQLVGTLYDYGFGVVVVDDGSTDTTGWEAKLHGARVIRHAERQGIRNSLLEAFKMALETKHYARFVQIDAGGSHDPAEVMRLLSHKSDVVIGSRFCPGGRYIGNPRRALLSRVAAALCNFAAPKAHISDWTSGYRVYSRAAIVQLLTVQYMTKMHTWQIEMLVEALKRNLTIEEAPITYTAGKSLFSLRMVDDAFQVWLWLLFS